MGLADKALTEQDYRQLILDEYTFLKRPVFLFDDEVTAGSAKAAVEAARKLL
jgi:arsenate reductase